MGRLKCCEIEYWFALIQRINGKGIFRFPVFFFFIVMYGILQYSDTVILPYLNTRWFKIHCAFCLKNENIEILGN